MGLDAVVYKSRSRLSPDIPPDLLEFDPETGQYWVENSGGRFPRDMFLAESIDVGNLQGVIDLREDLSQFGPARLPVILGTVLASAFQSGTVIGRSEVPQIEAEIALVRGEAKELGPRLSKFLTAMEKLVAASRSEGNPIVLI